MASFSVIITAGGIGKRMGGDIPKQFMIISQLPILMHTIKRFYDYDKQVQIIVTLPEEWVNYWKELVQTYEFQIPLQVVSGGVERYDSIKNALQHCTSELIAVHDGVRPMISMNTIKNTLLLAQEKGSAVPYLPLKESLRYLDGENYIHVDRNQYRTIQTPQLFKKEWLQKAYEIPFDPTITDDASLVEKAGFPIHFTLGNEENVKVTTPQDLEFVAFQLNKRTLLGQIRGSVQ
jgi:2-C-methyl-D-erythritol 4-phosphate cytidylyltransferase